MDGTQQVTVSVLTTRCEPGVSTFSTAYCLCSRVELSQSCQTLVLLPGRAVLSPVFFFSLSLSSREWCDRDRHCLLVQASTSCSHLSVNEDWLTRFLSSPVSYFQWENWKLAYRQFNGVPLMKSCQSFGSIRASLSFFRPCVGDDRWACPSALMRCNILLLEKDVPAKWWPLSRSLVTSKQSSVRLPQGHPTLSNVNAILCPVHLKGSWPADNDIQKMILRCEKSLCSI